MIEWDALFLTIPLSLPEFRASLTAIVLLIRQQPRLDRDVALWLIVPCAVLAFSAVTHFLPLWLEPVEDVVGSSNDELMFVWYGDMLFRTPAWAALLYGLFWKLPSRAAVPPLDARASQAALTAAILAAFLTSPETDGPFQNARPE